MPAPEVGVGQPRSPGPWCGPQCAHRRLLTAARHPSGLVRGPPRSAAPHGVPQRWKAAWSPDEGDRVGSSVPGVHGAADTQRCDLGHRGQIVRHQHPPPKDPTPTAGLVPGVDPVGSTPRDEERDGDVTGCPKHGIGQLHVHRKISRRSVGRVEWGCVGGRESQRGREEVEERKFGEPGTVNA